MTEPANKHGHKLARQTGSRIDRRGSLYDFEADAMKALAHPKRLLILDLLSDGQERNVSVLMEETGLGQSNLSQNLAVMRMAGLLGTRREGNVVYYRLTDSRVVKAVTLMRAVMEDQVKDRQFLMERAVQKKKEHVKRATTFGLAIVAGTLAVAMLAAAGHPLLVGGTPADVVAHTFLMVDSPDVATAAQVCMDVMTEPRAGPAPMPMVQASR